MFLRPLWSSILRDVPKIRPKVLSTLLQVDKYQRMYGEHAAVAITVTSFTDGKYIASTLTYVIGGGSIIVVVYFVLLFMF